MTNLPTVRKDAPLTTDNLFGPNMKKLAMRERLFVCLMFEGARNQTDAAEKAGFGPYQHRGSLRVKACQLMHDPKIKAAFIEESQRRNVMMLPSLEKALAAMIASPQHPDHFKAVKLGYEQAGVGLAKELNVNMNVTVTEPEKERQMRAWAAEMNRKGLGINVEKLLGTRSEPVDAEFSEVESIENDDELMGLR